MTFLLPLLLDPPQALNKSRQILNFISFATIILVYGNEALSTLPAVGSYAKLFSEKNIQIITCAVITYHLCCYSLAMLGEKYQKLAEKVADEGKKLVDKTLEEQLFPANPYADEEPDEIERMEWDYKANENKLIIMSNRRIQLRNAIINSTPILLSVIAYLLAIPITIDEALEVIKSLYFYLLTSP